VLLNQAGGVGLVLLLLLPLLLFERCAEALQASDVSLTLSLIGTPWQ
jgi:hypothetical protein